MKKILCTILFCLLLTVSVSAEESYDLLYPHVDGYARAVSDLKWGLLDEDLDIAVGFTWDYIGTLSENRRLVKKGELYGFLNEAHKTVISPAYVHAGNFSEGLCCVKNDEGKWGYINPSGKVVIPCTYDEVSDFSCGRALVKTEGFYGYIDEKNQFVIPATYEEAYPFYENRACVRIDEHYGYIDLSGSVVIPAIYELAFDFCGGGAVVKQESGYGMIDASGDVLIKPVLEQLSPQLVNGTIKGKKNGKWLFLDSGGQALSDAYADLGEFSDGFCPVKTEEGYGYLNQSFQLAISGQWDSVGAFSEGYAAVAKDGLYGYIDTNGDLVTKLMYTDAISVSAGYAGVLEPETGYVFIRPDEMELVEEEPDVPKESELPANTLHLQIDHDIMKVGEEEIILDASPILHQGHTMLPIRQVVEAIGGQVDWDPEERKISLFYESHSVVMVLGESGAMVDGRFTLLSSPPMIQNDRTLVPLRFGVESLGCEVQWIPETQEILITY